MQKKEIKNLEKNTKTFSYIKEGEQLMRIAIFDEGVNEVSSIKIKGGYNFRDDNINCIQKNDHGTSIAYIINKINPDVDLYSIVLPLKKDSKLDDEIVEAMCKGIDWCIDNKIKIINMSLGFNEVNKANPSGIIIDNGTIIKAKRIVFQMLVQKSFDNTSLVNNLM